MAGVKGGGEDGCPFIERGRPSAGAPPASTRLVARPLPAAHCNQLLIAASCPLQSAAHCGLMAIPRSLQSPIRHPRGVAYGASRRYLRNLRRVVPQLQQAGTKIADELATTEAAMGDLTAMRVQQVPRNPDRDRSTEPDELESALISPHQPLSALIRPLISPKLPPQGRRAPRRAPK